LITSTTALDMAFGEIIIWKAETSYLDTGSKRAGGAMQLTPQSKCLSFNKAPFVVVTLFVATFSAFGQDAPMASPPLTIKAGTVLTVRIDQALSSDRNQPGDVFSASLSQPIIVDGIVVAQRGQTVAGRVIDAKRAGRISGESRLAIALTSVTLVDGQNLPLQSELLVHNGAPATARDVAVMAGTTGTGALIGAAAGYGKGAAIGAGVGAAAGVLGVLMTRGYSTVIFPETPLAFQVTAPVTVETNRAPQAFRFVDREDYAQEQAPPAPAQTEASATLAVATPPVAQLAVYPYPYPYEYYGPIYYRPYGYYPYPYYAYPFAYGPRVSFYFGGPGYRYRPYYARPYGRPYAPPYRYAGRPYGYGGHSYGRPYAPPGRGPGGGPAGGPHGGNGGGRGGGNHRR
jgi:hypothetical protein